MVTSKQIISRLKALTGLKQHQIAREVFNISDKNLSNKIKRDTIDFLVLIHWAIHAAVDLNYLMAGVGLDKNKDISELLEAARSVLISGNPMAVDVLERNIRYFAHAIEIERRLSQLETTVEELKVAYGHESSHFEASKK